MAYHDAVRPLLRRLTARVCPGPVLARRRVAVIGLPRSGTSWLAKAVSLAGGVSYYFEPHRALGGDYFYRYVPPCDDDGRLFRHITKSFRGGFVEDNVIAEKGFRELLATPLASTVLIKWVRFSLCLEWLATHFPDLTVIQLVRHPVPQFLSWRQRGWDPQRAVRILLDQPKLMGGPLEAYRDVLERADAFWSAAAAFWGAAATMQLRAHRPGWHLNEHEWYCLEPERNVRRLIEMLGLRWNERVAEFLAPDRGRASGPGYGERRDPRTEVHKWEREVSRDEIAELAALLPAFGLPFYPDLEPEAFWAGSRGT